MRSANPRSAPGRSCVAGRLDELHVRSAFAFVAFVAFVARTPAILTQNHPDG
jgi:hypothetical protein